MELGKHTFCQNVLVSDSFAGHAGGYAQSPDVATSGSLYLSAKDALSLGRGKDGS
jgi:hypothetical protein